jgi:hypothetical protein
VAVALRSAVKYRHVAIAAALVVIVVALVLWHRQRPSQAPTTQATGSAGHIAAGRIPLPSDRPGRRVAGVVLLDGAATPGVAVHIDDTAPVLSDASGRFDLGVQRIARHVVTAEPPRLAGALVIAYHGCGAATSERDCTMSRKLDIPPQPGRID